MYVTTKSIYFYMGPMGPIFSSLWGVFIFSPVVLINGVFIFMTKYNRYSIVLGEDMIYSHNCKILWLKNILLVHSIQLWFLCVAWFD